MDTLPSARFPGAAYAFRECTDTFLWRRYGAPCGLLPAQCRIAPIGRFGNRGPDRQAPQVPAGRGVPAAEMSVAGFNVVSVMRAGMITRAPGGRAGVAPARPELPLAGRAPTGLHLAGRAPTGLHLAGRVPTGRELAGLEFAVVDLETTGWSPGAAAITEIGAVRVRG